MKYKIVFVQKRILPLHIIKTQVVQVFCSAALQSTNNKNNKHDATPAEQLCRDATWLFQSQCSASLLHQGGEVIHCNQFVRYLWDASISIMHLQLTKSRICLHTDFCLNYFIINRICAWKLHRVHVLVKDVISFAMSPL